MARLTADDCDYVAKCKLARIAIRGELAQLRRKFRRISRMPDDVRAHYDKLLLRKRQLSNEALAEEFGCSSAHIKNI